MRSQAATPSLSPRLTITRHGGPLASIEREWTRLVDPAHPSAAFRSFPWASAWWKQFSSGRETRVLIARNDGDVIGLLPLYAERTLFGGTRLRFLGDNIVGSDYLGVVARPADRAACAQAFARHLQREDPDALELDGLLEGDPLIAAVGETFASTDVGHRYRCPFVRTAGSWKDYLAELPDGLGAQFQRRKKWLEKQPGYRIERCVTPDEVERGVEILFALHRQRWALEGGSDAIDSPAVEAFHRDSAVELARAGWSRVWVLHVDGAPRAALYGWQHGDRFAFYQAGYDPEWRQRSVGTVLLGHIVRECYAAGLREYDFLRGSEPYKLKWANGFRQTVRLRARDASLRALLHDAGRTAYWRLREAGKRALPESALDWARRARKKVGR